MRRQPSPSIGLTLKTFDENNFIRIELALVVKLQILGIFDCQCLPVPMRIFERNMDEIFLEIDCSEICNSQRRFFDWSADRSPNINDLGSLFKEGICFIAGVKFDSLESCPR